MGKLEELINKLCPNGVEYKNLESITKSVNIGINPRKFFKLNPDDATGFYVTVRELNGLNGVNQTEKTDLINDNAINLIQTRANIEKGDILFSNTGTVGKMALVNSDILNWGVNEGIYVIKPIGDIIISKFLYYYLDSNLAYANYSRMFTGSTMKHITQKALLSLNIPVPPLEVQYEIVRILDDFTLLSAELSAELKARKKQYNYYRNALLSVNGKEYKLGDIANFKTGNKPKEILDVGEYEYINAWTTNSGYSREFNIDGNKVTTPSRGEGGIGFVGYQKNDFWLGPLCYAIWSKDENVIINKYLYYELSSKKDEILKRKNTGGVPALNGCDLKTIPINVPTIDEQKRIVSILDNFKKICEDTTEGLPAEIEARNKQYEYYRDILLSFKELKASEVK